MDNTAIARIARLDLEQDALSLLKRYSSNDDVLFFLGRLIWQGAMVSCVPPLIEIACDPTRGRYARQVSIRSVMALGDAEQKDQLWETLANQTGELNRELLAELLEWASPTVGSVDLLLRTLEHVAPYQQFQGTGLGLALHTFIDRLPLMVDDAEIQPLSRLIDGLTDFLGREPFVMARDCQVSEVHAWLMAPAVHAVDRLVAARCAAALSPTAIDIMRNVARLGYWRSGHFREYSSSLADNVPRWQALNDELYWSSLAMHRDGLGTEDQALTDDWPITFPGHFWRFGPEDFERCLGWARTKTDPVDQRVALSRCIQIFVEADRPAAWLKALHEASEGREDLRRLVETRLDPEPPPAMKEALAQRETWARQHAARERKEKKGRADWVRALQANPDRVRHPEGLPPSEFTTDQFHLMLSARDVGPSHERMTKSDWRSLIPEFGEPVARAYRDAAVAHWRAYTPALGSEGADLRSTPYSLIFAMTGLEIEAGEDSAFAQKLTEEEARHAFRYLGWELNGFPTWFEALYRARPNIGLEAVWAELVWQLGHSRGADAFPSTLHHIFYHAPWLHADVAPLILDWLRRFDLAHDDSLRFCIQILNSGGVSPDDLAQLAAEKVCSPAAVQQQPRWFALWVDSAPALAIPALESTLAALPAIEATTYASRFVTNLIGHRQSGGGKIGAFRNASDLKRLYILMHRYIRLAEDIERANKGAYSPTLRDHAQEARNTLFNLLMATPGPEAYAAIKALEQEHPEPGYRRWMAVRARERAIADADEPLWTVEQVRDFAQEIMEG